MNGGLIWQHTPDMSSSRFPAEEEPRLPGKMSQCPDEFKTRVKHLIAETDNADGIQGVERIYIPGDIEYLKREDYLKNGISSAPATLARLEQFGRDIGITTRFV